MWIASGARLRSAACLLALAGAHSLNAQDFRSGIDMVALAVTVTDGKGQPVTGLGARDFRVFDDGVPQEVALFGSAQVPLDVLLVFDTSSSMAAALPVVKSGARGLLSSLRAGDRAALVEVKRTINVPEALTADLPSIEAAMGRLSAAGSTALCDGVYLSLRQFERERRVRPELRRPALVLFSDGLDTASRMGFDEVIALARALDVRIYSITLQEEKGSADSALADQLREAGWQMRTLTRDTGGLSYFPKRIWELERIYETIARELVNQYALAYVAPVPGEGQTFRRVSIGILAPARGVAAPYRLRRRQGTRDGRLERPRPVRCDDRAEALCASAVVVAGGRWIGFFARGKLQKIAAAGGPVDLKLDDVSHRWPSFRSAQDLPMPLASSLSPRGSSLPEGCPRALLPLRQGRVV